jgi:Type I phosphodiesterase / nucleotide pyrophosphatase
MINEAPLAKFEPLGGGLLRPIYADYSFGNIPNTIEYLLTGLQQGPLLPADCFGGAYPRPQKLVLILVDSFGWQFWNAYRRRFRTLSRISERGTLTPISALFPSTTAASVSTLNLGVLPAQHALYEWNVYIPAYGEVIQTLAFSPLGRHPPDACAKLGYAPEKLLEVHETVHQRLARACARSSSRTEVTQPLPIAAWRVPAPRSCGMARWRKAWCSSRSACCRRPARRS